MTPEAQKWLTCVKKIGVNRTMGTVAVEAVLNHISMLIEKRPPLFRMALDAGFLDAVLEKIFACEASMGIVAVNTEDPALLEGMMAW